MLMTTFLALYQKELDSPDCAMVWAIPEWTMMSAHTHRLLKMDKWLFQLKHSILQVTLLKTQGLWILAKDLWMCHVTIMCCHHGLSVMYREGRWDCFSHANIKQPLCLRQFHLGVKEATYQADSIPQSLLACCTQSWSLGTASWHSS